MRIAKPAEVEWGLLARGLLNIKTKSSFKDICDTIMRIAKPAEVERGLLARGLLNIKTQEQLYLADSLNISSYEIPHKAFLPRHTSRCGITKKARNFGESGLLKKQLINLL